MNKVNTITKEHTILGIATGTNDAGFAIFQKGNLVDYQVKSYREKFSSQKVQRIVTSIQDIIQLHEVTAIAMKIPRKGKGISEGGLEIIAHIEKMARKKNMPFVKCNLSTLKKSCTSERISSRKKLAQCLMEKYPELTYIENNKLNRHTYYGKMVEAIAAGMQFVQSNCNC